MITRLSFGRLIFGIVLLELTAPILFLSTLNSQLVCGWACRVAPGAGGTRIIDFGGGAFHADRVSSDAFLHWRRRLRRTGVVAVVIIDDANHSERLVEALLGGGVDLLELTLRTPAALESMRRIRRAFPEFGLGAGTVLRPDQVSEVLEAGAGFGVAPGLNPRVVAAAEAAGLPFAPGVFSPSDIEQAVELGCRLLKYFPATADGQSRNFRTVIAPYEHLQLEYIPLGGLSLPLADAFLKLPSVVALGGSWIAPRDLIQREEWSAIRDNARAITQRVQTLRNPEVEA